ncbi:hypothetical protein FUA23_13495 [Neolewinella aurantiaca]|uniref:Cohesin domain-containing protein n=1 Tax=Neolewinella aurantiaca TaxID=2602767 RepID=A0A5C7FEK7_9BACT|nr:gliding motility-associated C-terminal domain-containing protein [Neolewinella aurantiaca]TXF88675.1 hypothetical protein FUA23_13495 [Neolewinella aurantiaca]
MHHGSSLRSFLVVCFIACLLAPLGLLAQRPVSITAPKVDDLRPSWQKMDCNDAGDINQFSGFMMQSTSFGDNLTTSDVRPYSARPDTIFLCADDQFTVSLVGGSQDLTGDPNTATTPGVGYAFYNCAPSVTGPLLTDIRDDACVADNGLNPFDDLAIAVPAGYQTGNYTLTVANDNVGGFTIPGLFPNAMAEPTPQVLTLAPITFDDVNATTGEAVYEGSPVGSCVNVSTDQAFTVAYLNPITLSNLDASPSGCIGTFEIRGGAPELRGGTGYNISIVHAATGERGVVLTPPSQIRHNEPITYQVPTAGIYRISIDDDGVGCSLVSNVNVDHPMGCPLPLVFNIGQEQGLPGQQVCVDVTAENFVDIAGFQFRMGFDPAVLQFDNLSNFHPNLPSAIAFTGPPVQPAGEVQIVYSDFTGTGATIPAGEVVFTACFTITGNLGDRSTLTNIDPAAEYTRAPSENGDLIVNSGSIVVTDKAFLVSLTRDNENCDGFNDGSIIAEALGGDDPYIFSIRRIAPVPEALFSGAQTRTGNPATAEFNGLQDAEYAIMVEAADGSVVIDTIEVEAGLAITVNVVVESTPSCNGFSDGSVRAAVFNNGVEITDPIADGYEFVWENSPETGDVRMGLVSGQYSVTVTSPNGCTSDDRGNLNQPSDVRVRPDNPDDAVSSATCTNTPDGIITISADGGTGPYDFMWGGALGTDDDATTSTRNTLIPDEYAVIVEDARGCRDTANFVVDAQKELIIVSEVDSITCFNADDGVIRVNGTATGSAPILPYEVTLLDEFGTVVVATQTIVDNTVPFEFTGLAEGRYVVVLDDQDPALGCEAIDTFDVFQPLELEIDENLTITNETCTTGSDGTVMASVSGGTMPYEYRFVNDSLDMPLDTITPGNSLGGLSADTNYVLFVTDANGCMDTIDFRINAPAGAELSVIDTSFISCPGDNDGMLTVMATPPTGETITSITWYNLNPDGTLGTPVASGLSTQNNLPVGDYVVEVITSNSCIAQAIGSVVSPGEVFLDAFTVNNPQCPDDANGSIFLTPGGGTANADGTYNYVWSTDPFGAPTTNPAFTNLTAGTYTVTITDGNGCQPPFDTTFTLVDPPRITGQWDLTPVSCPDDMIMDGTATFTAMYEDGTTGDFDFLFTSGTAAFQTTMATETGLPRGPVTVRVTDLVCTESFTDTIRSPDEFEVELLTDAVSCNGLTDGAATLNVTGGTPGYTYDWSVSTDTDNMVDGLAAGTAYTVDVMDANGCSPGVQTFSIAQPDPLTLSVDPVTTTETVRCAGDMNGQISVFVSSVNNNDLAVNPYSWSGNVAGPDEFVASDLSPGAYSVTVTDVEGCQDSLTYIIGEPEAIIFTVLPIEEPLCFGETTPVLIDTAFGGTSNSIDDFTFSVNNDGFRVPVGLTGTAFAGEVVVTVFDSVGCSAEQTFSVNQPPQILIDLQDEIVIELGDSLTRLNPLISPAGDVYDYLWTPGEFLSSDTVRSPLIYPLESRDYRFFATNANGCQAFADIFVEVDANRNVYIPNVFSPNRDGRNEDFRIFACQGVQRVNSVQIFDRWGGVVYSNDGFEPNCLDGIQLWDGTGQNGKPVNPAVFVYVIEVEFLDDVTLTYRGDVTVLR